MQANRSKDTKPELAVRRMLHAMGYRYQLHRADLPGKPDIVFPGPRKIVCVHGCFWHQHDSDGCRGARVPKARHDYWGPKLARNCARDAKTVAELTLSGWDVLIVWECWLKDRDRTSTVLKAFLSGIKEG